MYHSRLIRINSIKSPPEKPYYYPAPIPSVINIVTSDIMLIPHAVVTLCSLEYDLDHSAYKVTE